jgi:pentatricopeptide repeat protein
MAFAALDEMAKRWLAGEEALKTQPKRLKGSKPLPQAPKTNVHTKPTIEVVNGALSAFMQLPLRFDQKLQSMQKILQWAGRFGIKPNVYTYNILMALYVEAGDYPTIFKLLRQMEHEGIEGDLATYTTIIRAAFSGQRFDNLSQSQQANRILAIFAELEKGGVKLSDRLYSIAIDRLLKAYGNISAARTVIDHMSARNISPEPAVYASLITHYFQESPPNIEAVDGLLLRVFGPPRARTDKYFFDRVIEGYATHGEVGKMMSVLARMSSHGNQPGYRALTSIVKALVDAGDWERARLIVRDVQNGEGVARSGITGGRVLEQQFFRMIEQLGLNVTEPLAGEHLRPWATEPATLGAQDRAEGLASEDDYGQVPQGNQYGAPRDPYAQQQQSGHHGQEQGLQDVKFAWPADSEDLSQRREEGPVADADFEHGINEGFLSDEPEPEWGQEWKRKESG